jgi:hypothetical protein
VVIERGTQAAKGGGNRAGESRDEEFRIGMCVSVRVWEMLSCVFVPRGCG